MFKMRHFWGYLWMIDAGLAVHGHIIILCSPTSSDDRLRVALETIWKRKVCLGDVIWCGYFFSFPILFNMMWVLQIDTHVMDRHCQRSDRVRYIRGRHDPSRSNKTMCRQSLLKMGLHTIASVCLQMVKLQLHPPHTITTTFKVRIKHKVYLKEQSHIFRSPNFFWNSPKKTICWSSHLILKI